MGQRQKDSRYALKMLAGLITALILRVGKLELLGYDWLIIRAQQGCQGK
jgi:hypothetical protein